MHGMKEEVIPRILAKESLNLSPAKEGSSKKREREEQGLKRKRGETSVEKLHVLRKKREDEIYMLLGEILSKERKKGDHNFL
jgi:hypothetical protein